MLYKLDENRVLFPFCLVRPLRPINDQSAVKHRTQGLRTPDLLILRPTKFQKFEGKCRNFDG